MCETRIVKMSRLQVFWFLYITFVSSSHASIKQFLRNDSSPKCCNEDELLTIVSSDNQITYNCTPDVYRSSSVLTYEISPNFPWNSSDTSEVVPCVDAIIVNEELGDRETVKVYPKNTRKDTLNSGFFPKCCPFNSAYDTLEHKCVRITNETDDGFVSFTDEFLREHLDKGLFYVKPGLDDCDMVVVDYELDYFDETIFRENREIYLAALEKRILYGSYCVDKVYNSDSYVVRVCHKDYNICKKGSDDSDKIRCIRKCCPDGKIYRGGGKCKHDFAHGLDFGNDSKVQNVDEPFAIIEGLDCRKYMVEKSWDYTVDEMGNIKLNLEEDKGTETPFEHSYCFEHVELFGMMQERRLFLCFKTNDRERIEFEFSRIAMILSSICLTLTLLGYILLPEMQNLHGKTLMCHCGTLLVAFAFLATLQFHPIMSACSCMFSAYVLMYLFLAAFMWANIMCFDIWWTFGSMKVQGVHQKKKELKRLILYCLYAWTIPLVITGAAFSMQHFQESVPDVLQAIVPNLGFYNCFFEQQTNVGAFLTWFSLPIAVIIICNFVLYVKTIFYCYKVQSEIEKMKDTQSNKNERKKALSADRERMKMAVKLFLVMGIPWLFESISLCVIPFPATGAALVVQIIFDTFNCLQGVFIFCIFVLKIKFIHALRKKLGIMYLRRSSQSTSGTLSTYASKV